MAIFSTLFYRVKLPEQNSDKNKKSIHTKYIKICREAIPMILQLFISIFIVIGILLTVKGHLIQHKAYYHLGNILNSRNYITNGEMILTGEEESLFLTSLSGVRLKIIGVLLIAIPSSVLILVSI